MREKFFKLVGNKGKTKRQCWKWLGSYRNQYGSFCHKGKQYFAHRLSYELEHGTIMAGLVVLHKCDNPKCVNPHHLKVGSQRENIVDAFNKGRLYTNKVSKLNREKVDQIRALQHKHSHQKIADMFGVNRRTIGRIFTGEYWNHHQKK